MTGGKFSGRGSPSRQLDRAGSRQHSRRRCARRQCRQWRPHGWAPGSRACRHSRSPLEIIAVHPTVQNPYEFEGLLCMLQQRSTSRPHLMLTHPAAMLASTDGTKYGLTLLSFSSACHAQST